MKYLQDIPKIIMLVLGIMVVASIQYDMYETPAIISNYNNETIPHVFWYYQDPHEVTISNSEFLDGIKYDSFLNKSKVIIRRRIAYSTHELIIGKNDINYLLNSTFSIRGITT